MKYDVLLSLWPEACHRAVGCDECGNLIGPPTQFGSIVIMLQGSGFLPKVDPRHNNANGDCVFANKSHAIANRNALLEMAKAIDDVLPVEHQTMQEPIDASENQES